LQQRNGAGSRGTLCGAHTQKRSEYQGQVRAEGEGD
jgi:hypothetical protein